VKLADLDAQAQGYPGSHGLWTRGLLIRRSIADGACAFFVTWCPTGTQHLGQVAALQDADRHGNTSLLRCCPSPSKFSGRSHAS